MDDARVQAMYQELEAIFQSLSDEVVVTDAVGRVIRANPACTRFYGCSLDELIGRTVQELEREGYFSPTVTARVLEKRERTTLLQTTRTGRRLLTTGHPVFNESGDLILVVSTARDMTELQMLQQQLEATASEATRYRKELEELRRQQGLVEASGLVVRSPAMQAVLDVAHRVAAFDSTVLILGESGVGKNAIAKVVHTQSRRAKGPFVEINCGAIPESLLESELFGYVSGAFTGARKDGKEGLVELANGGTLFLNEVGELPLALQVKLLQVLQDRTLTRVGGTKQISVDVRVIAATNRDLEAMSRQGSFRPDLFYRLNVVSIRIPPLRERPEDVLSLVLRHLDALCARYGVQRRFSARVMDALLSYRWPGNVRELENIVERMVVTASGEIVDVADLPEFLRQTAEIAHPGGQTLTEQIEATERRILAEAYRQHASSYAVARALGISQSAAIRKLHKYGIDRSS